MRTNIIGMIALLLAPLATLTAAELKLGLSSPTAWCCSARRLCLSGGQLQRAIR